MKRTRESEAHKPKGHRCSKTVGDGADPPHHPASEVAPRSPIVSTRHFVSCHTSILNELDVLAGINPLALQPERLGIKWVARVRWTLSSTG